MLPNETSTRHELQDCEALGVLMDSILHVQIFVQQNILGVMKLLWKLLKKLVMAGNFFQKLWRGKS